jgi:uncharacterized secreted protein with C-terminal beta-propeller domain
MFITRTSLSRRAVLRGMGASLALPFLDAMVPAATALQRTAATPEFSQTNVQEAGVDEPDIVKTNGRTVFAIAGGRLHAIDVTGARPRIAGSLDLDGSHGHQLLIRGDRLLVMSSAYGGGPIAADVVIAASEVVLSEIDISDPALMKVLRTMKLDPSIL